VTPTPTDALCIVQVPEVSELCSSLRGFSKITTNLVAFDEIFAVYTSISGVVGQL